MRFHKKFSIGLLLFVLLPALLVAQSKFDVKGSVLDAQGLPLIGVNVTVKGTTTGTITDVQGNFSIKDKTTGDVLLVSYIGYISQEIKIKGQEPLRVVLIENAQNLSEVQVIGYGQKKKVTMTGAVVSINTAELLKSPSPNIGNILAGNMSGVSSVQYSGQPGADNPELFVRGIGSLTTANSSPLI
jgi:hypothetical protein